MSPKVRFRAAAPPAAIEHSAQVRDMVAEPSRAQATPFRVTLFPLPGVARFFRTLSPLTFDGLSASQATLAGLIFCGDAWIFLRCGGVEKQTRSTAIALRLGYAIR